MASWSLAPALVRLIASILIGLALASLVTVIHPRLRRPEAAGVRRAILGWWLPAVTGIVAVISGPWGSALITASVGVGCFAELQRMTPGEAEPIVDGLTIAAIPVIAGLAALGELGLASGLLLLWGGAALPLVWAALRGPQGVFAAASRRLFGLVLCGLALAHLPALAASPGGDGRLAVLLATVMVGDAFQFFFGKLFGRRRLASRLSPGKTWAGAIGGTLSAALVCALAAPPVLGLARLDAALLGGLLGVLGLAGDLLVSAIKRDAGVKDSGSAIPGQGGLLDRCDSLLISAPVFVHVIAPGLG